MRNLEKELLSLRLNQTRRILDLTEDYQRETRKFLDSPIIKYSLVIEIFLLLGYVFALGCWGYIIGHFLNKAW